MKRERVSFKASQYERDLKALEAEAAPITEARTYAAKIIGDTPKSLLAEDEVKDALSLPDYPAAPQHTAAELLGVIEELRKYRAALSKVKQSERFEVRSGKVVPTEESRKAIEEGCSLYFEGDKLQTYKHLKAAAKELNKIEQPMLRQAIGFGSEGTAEPNLVKLQMTGRRT